MMKILSWVSWLMTQIQTQTIEVPSGNTTPEVQAYYHYLIQTHLKDIPTDRATNILWVSPVKIVVWGLILIIVFYFYTYYFNRAHRAHGELYEATSFAGALLERNGTVTIFTWSIIIGLLLSAVYLGIRFIFLGYLY